MIVSVGDTYFLPNSIQFGDVAVTFEPSQVRAPAIMTRKRNEQTKSAVWLIFVVGPILIEILVYQLGAPIYNLIPFSSVIFP